MREILEYLQSIRYEIGDLKKKVEELSLSQNKHIEKTEKDISINHSRIKSINNKVNEIKNTVEPFSNEFQNRR